MLIIPGIGENQFYIYKIKGTKLNKLLSYCQFCFNWFEIFCVSYYDPLIKKDQNLHNQTLALGILNI